MDEIQIWALASQDQLRGQQVEPLVPGECQRLRIRDNRGGQHSGGAPQSQDLGAFSAHSHPPDPAIFSKPPWSPRARTLLLRDRAETAPKSTGPRSPCPKRAVASPAQSPRI